MRIGVDFDNTLVSYDDIFHRVALEQGAIPASTPRSKLAVRDFLRREGREEVWTEMQGTVYGARMDEVQAYPGALEFLKWARSSGIDVCIISHKTRHPFIGPRHDLHAAAQRWVDRHVGQIETFFELTKERSSSASAHAAASTTSTTCRRSCSPAVSRLAWSACSSIRTATIPRWTGSRACAAGPRSRLISALNGRNSARR